MNLRLREAFESEINLAIVEYSNKNFTESFSHFERAHILGQSFVIPHTRAHWWMLKIGLRTNNIPEVFGQIARIVASILFSRIWVPIGNTGGANVSAIKPMPIPEDLKEVLGNEK